MGNICVKYLIERSREEEWHAEDTYGRNENNISLRYCRQLGHLSSLFEI